MNQVFIPLVASAMSLLILSSCGASGAPECSNSNVKALVIDISLGEIRNQLLSQAIITQMRTSPQVQGNPTYEQWSQLMDENESIKEVINYVDKQISDVSLALTGIRTNSKNDEIMKTQCGGDLMFANGNSHSIEYTAQYTDDGQVYVEVFGL